MPREPCLNAPQARCIAKVNSALAPFAELGNDVFGQEDDGRGPPDQLVVFRIGIGCDQPQHRGAVRRRDRYQAVTRLKAGVQSQIESELIPVEFQAAILISDKNVDRVNAQVGVLRSRRTFMPVGCAISDRKSENLDRRNRVPLGAGFDSVTDGCSREIV